MVGCPNWYLQNLEPSGDVHLGTCHFLSTVTNGPSKCAVLTSAPTCGGIYNTQQLYYVRVAVFVSFGYNMYYIENTNKTCITVRAWMPT